MVDHCYFGESDLDQPNPYYMTPTIPCHQDYRSFPPCSKTRNIQYQSNGVINHQFIDYLPENIKYIILQKVIYTRLIEQSNNAYNKLCNSPHVEFEMFKQPCWGLCHINEIPDNECLQDLLILLKRPGFAWRIIIKAMPNEYLRQFITSLGSMPLHPQDHYDPPFATSIASVFALAWNISFDFDILQDNPSWSIQYKSVIKAQFPPISYRFLLRYYHPLR